MARHSAVLLAAFVMGTTAQRLPEDVIRARAEASLVGAFVADAAAVSGRGDSPVPSLLLPSRTPLDLCLRCYFATAA
jgi:hypothetical protein